MADQAKRGGQKQGQAAGSESKKHQGVRPESTTQNKAQRQKEMERKPNKDSRVADEK